MATDISDLSGTITPKSDQLNSEQLLSGPITITVDDVRIGNSEEQPVTIHYKGENGRPYKPCKTCRKMLIFAWGKDGSQWIGRSITLYNDQLVRFGGAEVGGIRISHLSDIQKDIIVSLNSARGKKAPHTIKRMERVNSAESERLAQLAATGYDCADMGVAALAQFWKGLSKADQAHFAETKDTKWKPRAEASQAAA